MKRLPLALLLILSTSCSVPIAGSGADPAPVLPPLPAPALEDQVWYELNFHTLSPATLSAAEARLEAIQALGVNVLWLMPVYPNGVLRGSGSPYAVKNYFEVNPSLGTLEDLRSLVKAAHARGIRVVLDWVPNHTSWDNPWITQHPDWYQQAGGSIIGPPEQPTWKDVAALNYQNQALWTAMADAMAWWITNTGVDGFRCDYADNQPAAFWTQALDRVNRAAGSPRILLAEGSKAWQFTSGFALNYAWDFYYQGLKAVWAGAAPATKLLDVAQAELAAVPAGASKLRYSANHDVAAWDGSTVNFFGGQDGAVAAFAATVFSGGVPLIFSGQEAGSTDKISFFGPSPVDWTAHPDVTAEHARLIGLRKAHTALRSGSLVRRDSAQVVAFERVAAADRVFVLINPSSRSISYTVPAAAQGPWTDTRTSAPVSVGSSLSLGAYEVRVLSR